MGLWLNRVDDLMTADTDRDRHIEITDASSASFQGETTRSPSSLCP